MLQSLTTVDLPATNYTHSPSRKRRESTACSQGRENISLSPEKKKQPEAINVLTRSGGLSELSLNSPTRRHKKANSVISLKETVQEVET